MLISARQQRRNVVRGDGATAQSDRSQGGTPRIHPVRARIHPVRARRRIVQNSSSWCKKDRSCVWAPALRVESNGADDDAERGEGQMGASEIPDRYTRTNVDWVDALVRTRTNVYFVHPFSRIHLLYLGGRGPRYR